MAMHNEGAGQPAQPAQPARVEDHGLIPNDVFLKLARRAWEAVAGYDKLHPGDVGALLREVRVHRAYLLGWTTREFPTLPCQNRYGVVFPADGPAYQGPLFYGSSPADALVLAHQWCEMNCPATVDLPGDPWVAHDDNLIAHFVAAHPLADDGLPPELGAVGEIKTASAADRTIASLEADLKTREERWERAVGMSLKEAERLAGEEAVWLVCPECGEPWGKGQEIPADRTCCRRALTGKLAEVERGG